MRKQPKNIPKKMDQKSDTEFANEIAAFAKETKQPMNGYDRSSAR
ncbi:MAG: hypothetical protein ACI35O_10095 [Bacillaceae bacterium]